MTRALALPFAALALALGACGDDQDGGPSSAATTATPTGYTPAVRAAFVANCERTSGGKTAICECAYANIAERVPFGRSREADEAIRRGEEPAAATELLMRDAAEDCS